MKLFLSICLFSVVAFSSAQNNVGIGTSSPMAKLDIKGDLILESKVLVLPEGVNYQLDLNTAKYNHYKLTGPTSNFQIAGIAGAAHDRIVSLYNRTGVSMEIYNDDINTLPEDRILTGTGGIFAVYNGGNVVLKYDTTMTKWEIISSHYNSLDNFGSVWASNANDVYNTNSGQVGIGTTTPDAKLVVNGTFKVVDGSQGAGKILTSDATGLASWQPPPPPPATYSASVGICCQSWMTRNLDVSTYKNGDVIPQVTDAAEWSSLTTGAYCYFNNDSTTYAATYGKLYNWYAINDPRGLAPEGWHIPSDFEWTTLASCLGGPGVAGDLLKEKGTVHWTPPNTGTNLSNFTGLPGGNRSDAGNFPAAGMYGQWWSLTEDSSNTANTRYLINSSNGIYINTINKKYGCSVRCIRD